MPSEPTHGQLRLGMLTSSKASVIMRASPAGLERYSRDLWNEDAEQFDAQAGTPSMRYGHAHEAEGAAKFWDAHPEVVEMRADQFFMLDSHGVPLGSSPDRVLLTTHGLEGLEVKSPTKPEDMARHTLKYHMDQCQHGMLVTGFKVWWLTVHYGTDVSITRIDADPEWQAEYLRRAAAFWKFHTTGEAPWKSTKPS